MVHWAIERGAFDIKYTPQTVMEFQVIADFIVEFSVSLEKAQKKLNYSNLNGIYT